MWFTFSLSFYLLFLFLLFLSGTILFLPFKVRISIDNLRKDNSVSWELEIFLPGSIKLFRFKKNILLKQNAGIFMAERGRWKYWYEKWRKIHFRKVLFLIYRLMRSLKWNQLDIRIKIGTDEAARTGLLTGFIRQCAAIVSRYLWQKWSFKQRPLLLIYPSFRGKEFVFSLYVEFYTRGIIVAYYSVLILWEAVYRAYIQHFWRMVIDGRTPHPGLDDNSHGKFKGNG